MSLYILAVYFSYWVRDIKDGRARSRKWQIRHKGAAFAHRTIPRPECVGGGFRRYPSFYPLLGPFAAEIFLGRRYSGIAMAKSRSFSSSVRRRSLSPLVSSFHLVLPFRALSPFRRRVPTASYKYCACVCVLFLFIAASWFHPLPTNEVGEPEERELNGAWGGERKEIRQDDE